MYTNVILEVLSTVSLFLPPTTEIIDYHLILVKLTYLNDYIIYIYLFLCTDTVLIDKQVTNESRDNVSVSGNLKLFVLKKQMQNANN